MGKRVSDKRVSDKRVSDDDLYAFEHGERAPTDAQVRRIAAELFWMRQAERSHTERLPQVSSAFARARRVREEV